MDPVSILVGLGVPQKFARALAYAILAVVIVLVLAVAKCTYDSRVISSHDAQQQVKTLQSQQSANDNAAAARANQTIALSNQEQEAHNAIHSVPDAAPAAPSIRLGCQRLRRSGQDISRIPACSGLTGGH